MIRPRRVLVWTVSIRIPASNTVDKVKKVCSRDLSRKPAVVSVSTAIKMSRGLALMESSLHLIQSTGTHSSSLIIMVRRFGIESNISVHFSMILS